MKTKFLLMRTSLTPKMERTRSKLRLEIKIIKRSKRGSKRVMEKTNSEMMVDSSRQCSSSQPPSFRYSAT